MALPFLHSLPEAMAATPKAGEKPDNRTSSENDKNSTRTIPLNKRVAESTKSLGLHDLLYLTCHSSNYGNDLLNLDRCDGLLEEGVGSASPLFK